MLPESTKSRLRAALPILELAQKRSAKVVREPSGWKVPCPWHGGGEKTPSLHIYADPDRGFHCFSCGKGGDVFTWLMDIEGMTFPESVEHLAALAGIPQSELRSHMPAGESESTKDLRRRVLQVLEEAGQWYSQRLHAGESRAAVQAQASLAERKLPAPFEASVGFGYAPDAWDGLAEHLRGAGHSPELLIASGIIGRSQKTGRLYDMMRHRLVIPIRSRNGQILSFGGRALSGGQAVGEGEQPKYLNGRETEVFSKDKVLYGLDRALGLRIKTWVLVEGYFDALALLGASVPAVATMGTAFGGPKAQEIGRAADVVILWFDPDPAGQKATAAAIPFLLAAGLRVRIMRPMRDGSAKLDPDLVVRRVGTSGIQALLDNSAATEDWASWLLPYLADTGKFNRSSRQDRAILLRKMVEVLVQGYMDREPSGEIIAQLAAELEVAPSMVRGTFVALRKDAASAHLKAAQDKSVAGVPENVLIPNLHENIWLALEHMADGDARGLEVVRQVPTYLWETLPNGGVVLEILENNGVPTSTLGSALMREAAARRAAKISAGNPMVLHLRIQQWHLDLEIQDAEKRLQDPMVMAQPEIYRRLVEERRDLLLKRQQLRPGAVRKALEG